jgi:coproporphyrinogen III oxidase
MLSTETIETFFRTLQNNICEGFEQEDGKGIFLKDVWERPEGGGGITCIMQNGNFIEKGGVNFSAVHGHCPDFLKKEAGIRDNEDAMFYASGVSLVMHPVNPMVPIIHMNVRYIKAGNKEWFGGGIDLTPHYIIEDDAKMFHKYLKIFCDKFNFGYYPEFKKWADDYFFIAHRNETRGIGGIFFDRLSATDSISMEDRFNFVKAIGNSLCLLYLTLIYKNHRTAYNENNKKWQLLRRGRYVEFNLVYDRGTKFGLFTNGRAESILMTLPPLAGWEYAHQPDADSPEGMTLRLLRKGIDWINFDTSTPSA